MTLKRLELSGFKSFPKKTTLEFSGPITAIVGPNGSGKSNIVEAIRFVLGEQKMKSLRGKSGADLIFKGSKSIPRQNRASVSIIFDNTKKAFSGGEGLAYGGKLDLDYDEIIIKREVHRDGVNHYFINNTEVRLKDILEVLSGVNIGSSGHHIISQGETDRILNVSPRERKDMIEDALGLKVYKYKLKESERKLDRTNQNMKEAQSLRREIAPHIKYLKNQVEKIEKAENMRKELETLYKDYLKREDEYTGREGKALEREERQLREELDKVNQGLGQEISQEEESREKSAYALELETTEQKLRELRTTRDELSRSLGRIEGMIEIEEKNRGAQEQKARKTTVSISIDELTAFVDDLNKNIDEALAKGSVEEITPILSSIKKLVSQFIPKRLEGSEGEVSEVRNQEIEEMTSKRDAILTEINKFENEEKKLQEKAFELKHAIEKEKQDERKQDQLRFELMMKKRDLESKNDLLDVRKQNALKTKTDFEEELEEAKVLIGSHILSYEAVEITDEDQSRTQQEKRRKKLERLKIKLEDAGAAGGSDTLKEYEEATQRDQFLTREIQDLEKSVTSLETIMKELQEKINSEFKDGIEEINIQFEEFFQTIFGGGTASLAIIAQQKRKRGESEIESLDLTQDDSQSESEEELAPSDLSREESREVEEGIEINVSLPRKRAKDLHALSGGERSLTSIALLFAMTQVNPPPFLVLDETDAALDEANSRRYGDMLEKLAKHSDLVVVTHNRETMSRVNVLYGVTIGADGASKLLSVKFDEAVAIAK